MLDDKSLKIEKQEFLSRVRKFKPAKMEKFRSAIKAIHTNLVVSETIIWPLGVITNDTAKQAGFLSNIFGNKQSDSQPIEENKTASGEAVHLPQGSKLDCDISAIPIFIDGIKYEENAKKIVVKRYKKDNVHVAVPIVTFLPLRLDDLTNFKF